MAKQEHRRGECWCGINHNIVPMTIEEASRRITAGEPLVHLRKQIESGERFIVTIEGVKREVEMLDVVLVDRSAGQHEPGWWIVDPAIYDNDDMLDDDEGMFFLSAEGVVYEKGSHGWDVICGFQPELQRDAKVEAALDAERLTEMYGSELEAQRRIGTPPQCSGR